MIVTAPAKINLTLEVIKKRPDGFHEIRSVVQTLSYGDKIKITASPRLEIKCNLPAWSLNKSLVNKTVSLLRNSAAGNQGALIEIEKRIPLSSGLGGDSSDAAAILRGLGLLWNLKLSQRDLLAYGAQLGSDVSLFLYGGTLLLEGRGEIIRPLKPMPHMSVILLVPPLQRPENKTQLMYSQLTVRHYSSGQHTRDFINMLEGRAAAPGLKLYNVFDSVGLQFFTALSEYKKKFEEAGAVEVHLAGSGPTLYTALRDDVRAYDIHQKLLKMKLEAYLTEF
ncbi:MAG TPA: 4-(cytidine 5'-diphospho)-2-C-methyl-D-erythritol kinase [Dehalococcoidales bacterium]|nr:4-(cytidine 5'-diphospho)-2-C-methyl-D-erythritol kinase [Dehalococcoidales bacterium]